MSSSGVVREFHPVEGWGVIDAADVPGGCWVHFSAIAGSGYLQLTAGQEVSFRYEAVSDQDGFKYTAVKVWLHAEPEPSDSVADVGGNPGAYRSSLIIEPNKSAEK
jgi:cold shock protein